MNLALPADEDKTAHVRAMFDRIAPRYDLVNRLMTFGLDQRWRRQTIDALALPADSLILDLACGTGDLTKIAGRRGYRVIGLDGSHGMLAANRTGAPLAQGDAGAMGISAGSLDGLVSGYALRNFTDLGASLKEAARVLRPGGRMALLEVAKPKGRLLGLGHRLWFERAVPIIGGILSDGPAYRYLPASTTYLPPDYELRRLLRDAGFRTVGTRMLSGGLSQLITGTRAGMP